MQTVLNDLMAHGGSLWLLENEIPRYFDRKELSRAEDSGLVSITPGKASIVRIKVTFKGRRYLKKLAHPSPLRRIWLSFTGLFTHRLDD